MLPSSHTIKGSLLAAGAAGVFAKASILIAANVADAETVTIGPDTYEFDRAGNGVAAGNIAVTGHADDTPTNATPKLVAAINASSTIPVEAIQISVNHVLLLSKVPGPFAYEVAETMAGTGNVVDATFSGGYAPTAERVAGFRVVPTANEVAAGLIVIPVDFVPYSALVQVRVTSSGAAKAWDGKVTFDRTNKLVKIDNTGSTDWAATDDLNVLVF